MLEARAGSTKPFINLLVLQLCFLASFFGIGADFARAKDPDLKRISASKEWLRLLHFRLSFANGRRSEVSPSDFFLSPDGHFDPYQELLASINAFSNPDLRIGRDKIHPQCALPLRFEFLSNQLDRDFPRFDCPSFQEYLESLQVESVTVVFASAFQSNAASMFGHIFLRLDSPGKSPLISRTLSYAADISPGENPLLFAIRGVLGGYEGRFSLIPYYQKIKEYDQLEARDLWEYRLHLSSREARILASHAWELDQTAKLKYYFFDLNCAYQLLALLEVAKPDWDLTAYGIHVLPVDALKKTVQLSGAVTKVTWRPASEKVFDASVLGLDVDRRKTLFSILNGESHPTSEDPEILRMAAEWKVKQESEVDRSQLYQILSHLNELTSKGSVVLPNGVVGTTGRPDWGHASYRFGFSFGANDKNTMAGPQRFFDFEFRTAYHDLLDPDLGYTAFSEITFPSVKMRTYEPFRALSLERIDLVNIVSLVPQRPSTLELSWNLLSHFSTPKDQPCFDCKVLNLEGGGGMSWADQDKDSLVYVLGGGATAAGDILTRGYRWGPKVEAGWLVHPFVKYKLQLRCQRFFWSTSSGGFDTVSVLDLNQSWSLEKDWSFRFNIQQLSAQKSPDLPVEASFSVFKYF